MRNDDIDISKNEASKEDTPKRKHHGIGGIILVIIGLGLLLRRINLGVPDYYFSWQTLLIAIGLVIGIKSNFRFGAWLVMVLVGGIFLAAEAFKLPYNTAQFIWPVVMIMVGIMMIFKRSFHMDGWKKDWKNKDWKDYASKNIPYGSMMDYATGEDVLDATAIFGSVNKVIVSKNFKGGAVTSIFGGSTLNFMKADIDGMAILDVTAVMGGCELIVPANWKVQMDLTTIMGGVEDKRFMEAQPTGPEKILKITGACVMGGVEVKSY